MHPSIQNTTACQQSTKNVRKFGEKKTRLAGFGIERAECLKGLGEKEIAEKVQGLAKLGETMPKP